MAPPARLRPIAPALVVGGLVVVLVLGSLFAAGADAGRSRETPTAAFAAGRAAPPAAATTARDSVPAGAAQPVQAAGQSAAAGGADTTGVRDSAGLRLPPPGELARLTYQREFFDYDGAGRRDPFKPLLDLDSDLQGPRFEELVLTGIFKGDDGDGMVVVEDARKGYFLKRGDVVGKATLVDFDDEQAVFDVRDYGISRRETLKLQRPEETP
jgi:hypothetical protein